MSIGAEHPERVMMLAISPHEASHTPPLSERTWRNILAAVQQTVPGAVELQHGWCAMRARGPSRYYGSEVEAAQAVLRQATTAGAVAAIVAVASGRFVAHQAALAAEGDTAVNIPAARVRIVASEHTAAFLAALPIERAVGDELALALTRLGVCTLGAFAALPEDAVLQRFGRAAAIAHRRARGLGEFQANEVPDARPVHELHTDQAFEPAIEDADTLAFACRAPADRFAQVLNAQGLVCTELLLGFTDDTGRQHERHWSHPSHFTPPDLVNRVRWQAAELPRDPDRGGAGVAEVRFTPVHTARASEHEPGLWNTAPNERVHHQLTRVQHLVGHHGVGTGVLLGGRLSADRQALMPWGSTALPVSEAAARPRDGPWPGSLTGTLPNTVFAAPITLSVLGSTGTELGIDDDELLSDTPAMLCIDSQPPQQILAWSAPWPLRERWWAASQQGHNRPPIIFRLQVLLDDGEAWLLRFEPGKGWCAEARYS